MTDKKKTVDDPKSDHAEKLENVANSKPAVSASSAASKEKLTSAEKATDKITANSIKTGTTKATRSSTANSSNMSDKASVQKPSSKSGPLALVLSLLAIAGIGGHYYWQTQQQQLLSDKVLKSNKAQLQVNQQQFKQALNQEQNQFAQQVSSTINKALNDTDKQVIALAEQVQSLNNQVTQLSQNQPSDWLLQEAEYLIRVASRSLWLEKSPKVALSLLADANERIKELNDPSLLSLRKVISKDIEALRLLPELAIDDVILTLMGLSEQVSQLPIAMVHLPDTEAAVAEIELSENANDWRANLAKSWNIFMEDFITVRRRTANVEPLLSPTQQQNLRQNLQLKLQLGQWAASQQKPTLFKQAIVDTQTWLIEYFDTDALAIQQFNAQLEGLKAQTVSLSLPESLQSLAAIRGKISQKNITKKTNPALSEESTHQESNKQEVETGDKPQESAEDNSETSGEAL
jgi:uroporphyrin-III C-methyltransferase